MAVAVQIHQLGCTIGNKLRGSVYICDITANPRSLHSSPCDSCGICTSTVDRPGCFHRCMVAQAQGLLPGKHGSGALGLNRRSCFPSDLGAATAMAEAELRACIGDLQSRVGQQQTEIDLLKTLERRIVLLEQAAAQQQQLGADRDRELKNAVITFVTSSDKMTEAIKEMAGRDKSKGKIDRSAARDHHTPVWSGTMDKKTAWIEFKDAVIGWAECVAPGSTEIMDVVERTPIAMSYDLTPHLDAETRDALDRALYWFLTSKVSGSAKNRVKGVKRNEGFKVWHTLCHYGAPRSQADNTVQYMKLMNQKRCQTIEELMSAMAEWEQEADEFETRFEMLSDTAKVAAVKSMCPEWLVNNRLSGEQYDYQTLVDKLRAIGADRSIAARESTGQKPKTKKDADGDDPMGMDALMEVTKAHAAGEVTEDDLKSAMENALMQMSKQKPGPGKGGSWGSQQQRQQQQQSYQSHSDKQQEWRSAMEGNWTTKGGKWGGKGGLKGGNAKGGDGKGKGKGGKGNSQCHNCKGYGHFARECPSRKGAGKGINEVTEEENHEGYEHEEDWTQEADDGEEPPVMILQAEHSVSFDSDVLGRDIHSDLPIFAMSEASGGKRYKRIEATIDSGSVDHVFPEALLPMIELQESEMSRRGARYRTATKEPVKNLGQKKFRCKVAEGHDRCMVVQVAQIDKPLISVTRLNDTGHAVQMSSVHPHIKHEKSGEITKLRRRGKSFVLDLWVEIPSTSPKTFQRQ